MSKPTERKRPRPIAEDSQNRREEILEIASQLFMQRGYDKVSMRQIGDAAGIMGASIYYHFPSKKDLFVEAHRIALRRSLGPIKKALESVTDPWERLEVTCAVHLATQLDPNSITMSLMRDPSALASEMRDELVKERDEFEQFYKTLVANLPLPPDVDRDIFRLCLLSQLNTVDSWYKPGRLTPAEISKQIVRIFRT